MMKHSKKLYIAAAITLATAVFALTGCGVSISTSSTTTKETTETVEDQDGNKHEVTHTVETENGDTTEYYEGVSFEIVNDMDEEITGVYISNSDSDSWGENLLEIDGESYVLGKGDSVSGLELSYSSQNPTIDIKIETADGGEVTFDGYDLTNLKGANQFTIRFNYDADTDAYSVDIES